VVGERARSGWRLGGGTQSEGNSIFSGGNSKTLVGGGTQKGTPQRSFILLLSLLTSSISCPWWHGIMIDHILDVNNCYWMRLIGEISFLCGFL